MRDWKQFVREHLPPLNLGGAREQEIVEEIAQQLEDAYTEAISRGVAPAVAEGRAVAQISDWPALALEIRRAEQPIAHEVAVRVPPKLRVVMKEENIRNRREGICSRI